MSMSPMSGFDDLFSRFFGAERPVQRVDLTRLLSSDARDLVDHAAEQAAKSGNPDLGTEHLLSAAAQLPGSRQLLQRLGADPDRLVDEVRQYLTPARAAGPGLSLTPAAKRALLDAHRQAREAGSTYIGSEHVLLGLAANPETPAGRILRRLVGADPRTLPLSRAPQRPSTTPTLDEYGRDLTEEARHGTLDPVIGRADEVEQTIEVLSRRTKNNPVLIGDPGVGKTAIVEGIAQRIVTGDVPRTLANRRLVALDLAGMVAGAKYRGEFEERLTKVIDEVRESGVVLFVDELHTIVGAGAAGDSSMDAGTILKPALSRGELNVVGATTVDEYRTGIEKDPALERRFQPILVAEPGVEDTVAILRGLRDRYEAHHQVRITEEALVAAAELSDRYIPSRFLPDKAIDLIDQAGARVRLKARTPDPAARRVEDRLSELRRNRDSAVAAEDYDRAARITTELEIAQNELSRIADENDGIVPEVTAVDIAEVVARRTGIPVSRVSREEKERLLTLEAHLHGRVIGQDEAVGAVARAVRRARAGMADPRRPDGSFLFLGPTGVGKTELARTLAEALFGDQDRMIRFDMSEFQERHTVSRLVGAPPGYVGYADAGQLTEAVRRKPYSVLLFDEIEKAHPDVFNTLLQLLDDGRLTDGQGRTVSFASTVVIMTSNLGADRILSATASGLSVEDLREELMGLLGQRFRPEFLNRIDDIILFQGLDTAQLRQITTLLVEQSRARLRAQHVDLELTDTAIDLLAGRGHQPQFGARPLRRTVQRLLDDELSEKLLAGAISAGDTVYVTAADGELAMTTSPA
ncbi:putative ATPase associated with various cellular activities [Actinoplanes missouriensis 431]|uniref:Putative ATPase associated with various cellular activities n=1 Tax=Actinoplanes missouriensis (strain ATCC 14538 / DSM 43046 / CBS 188.64 / JCM 3121 / NBRC 102363 / NCIMB 12654 / NRRL B-3342 / UNCC 431) TaxID=512565 RepID=I0H870_ACTM4|nr:ATP-dependent Clp protease ATP-binding subunit [Actinoplanes missouriensis]BAL89207.1 putative ATPase associated with various cellular activities [Actinoplanes missouriensis 431]